MTTIREQALRAIKDKLVTAFPDIDVARNRTVRSNIDDAGEVILYDGEEVDRLEELSPPFYVMTWSADVQIFVQNPDKDAREECLDDLISILATTFSADTVETLGGLVHYVIPTGLDLLDEPVEGAGDIKTAVIVLRFEYGTSSPLG